MTAQERMEILAAAVHQAWYCVSVLSHHERGNTWTSAPDWQKSVIYHTVAFWESMDFTPASHFEVGRVTHAVWMKYMSRQGWVYGPTLDLDTKTDPDMVSFDNLPESEREKDYAVIDTYLVMRVVLGEPSRNS